MVVDNGAVINRSARAVLGATWSKTWAFRAFLTAPRPPLIGHRTAHGTAPGAARRPPLPAARRTSLRVSGLRSHGCRLLGGSPVAGEWCTVLSRVAGLP